MNADQQGIFQHGKVGVFYTGDQWENIDQHDYIGIAATMMSASPNVQMTDTIPAVLLYR